MKGIDHRGLPKTVLVEARSLFEAAAEGLEKLHRDGGCRFDQLEVTVREPRGTFAVRPGPARTLAGKPCRGRIDRRDSPEAPRARAAPRPGTKFRHSAHAKGAPAA